MNRIDRLTSILIQLQTKKWVTAAELADRYGISLRTIYRDMRALEEAGVPIGAESGKGYFIMEGYHLPPVMFSKDEAGSIIIAEKLVEKMTDASVKENFGSAVSKIKSVLPQKEKDFIEMLDSHIMVYGAPILKSHREHYISMIQEALARGKCLLINYQSNITQNQTFNRIIDPLGIVFYSNCWHLIGYCYLRNDMRDFRIDCILKMEMTNRDANMKDKGKLKEYLEDYRTKGELFEAKVWFTNNLATAITSSRFYFGFIDEEAGEDGIVMNFAISEFGYFANWLLSFGSQIRIIDPPELHKVVTDRVRELANVYLDT